MRSDSLRLELLVCGDCYTDWKESVRKRALDDTLKYWELLARSELEVDGIVIAASPLAAEPFPEGTVLRLHRLGSYHSVKG